MNELLTANEIYEVYKNEVIGNSSEGDLSDFSDGSMNDVIAGAVSIALNEIIGILLKQFQKTFFSTAKGDDLEHLAVDHFGDQFKKPKSSPSSGLVTFSRPNSDEGDVLISIGTILLTDLDSQGNQLRFKTTQDITLVGTNINCPVTCDSTGSKGNILPEKITSIEQALSDSSISVSNISNMSGGSNVPEDDQYRTIISSLIESLAGATEEAVLGMARSVSGVFYATPTTEEKIVKTWSIENSRAEGDFFRIPYPVLYIADINGNSSPQLVSDVIKAISSTQAAGVKISVRGAKTISLDITVSFSLNSSGDNFSVLQSDSQPILDSINDFIKSLPIGQGFDRIKAVSHIKSIWGTDGSNDLASFEILNPTASVVVDSDTKLIVGTLEIG